METCILVDGRAIAENIFSGIKSEIETRGVSPHLTVFTCNPNFETQKFLKIKRKKADDVGIVLDVRELDSATTTEAVISAIVDVSEHTDGIIVQLPFPKSIDTTTVISNIPTTCDVDALNLETTSVLAPVVGAIVEVIHTHSIEIVGKNVVVVGAGNLVGKPSAKWFQEKGIEVTVVTKETDDLFQHIARADVLVLGAGSPAFITKEHIKEGVVVIDAGTSEDWGELKGDADPNCAEVASLFTPVPGGIGPITVAVLLKNLMELSK